MGLTISRLKVNTFISFLYRERKEGKRKISFYGYLIIFNFNTNNILCINKQNDFVPNLFRRIRWVQLIPLTIIAAAAKKIMISHIFSLFFEFLPLQIASPRGSACSCVRARLRGAWLGLANSENKQFNNNLSGNDKESFRSVPEAPGPAPAAAEQTCKRCLTILFNIWRRHK